MNQPTTVRLDAADDIALADRLKAGRDQILTELHKLIIGQGDVIEQVLLSLFVGGNSLIVGVPGLAKTLLIHTIARVLDLRFSRIQFTPDLMPSDITGTDIIQEDATTGRRSMVFMPGPIFANIVLADEINRAPPKVQSALLEGMQEQQVTLGGETHALPKPFLVLATQNPIEQEGTYPLPEAQVDRFMLKLHVGYPTRDMEKEIMRRMAGRELEDLEPVAKLEELFAARQAIADLYMDEKIADYIVDVVHATREPGTFGLGNLASLIEYGASPRATIYLSVCAKAHAYLRGRGYVLPDDVKAMAPDVLRHRIITSFEAEAEEVTSDHIIARIFEAVDVP